MTYYRTTAIEGTPGLNKKQAVDIGYPLFGVRLDDISNY